MQQKVNTKKEFCQTVRQLGMKHDTSRVFCDYLAMAAISLQQPFVHSPELESEYMEIRKSYNDNEFNDIAKLFALTVDGLSWAALDFLGECFHELELHNSFKGQFFTPFNVSRMMAEMVIDGVVEQIKKCGFAQINEPTCGAGGMVIALADALKQRGYNPVNTLFVVAQDIDPKCFNMTYIQLSLLAIPAVVILGDTLTMENRKQALTAGYYLGEISQKLHQNEEKNKPVFEFAQPKQKSNIGLQQIEFNF